MARRSERRVNTRRREILDLLNDPILIQFAREEKSAKQIVLLRFGEEIAKLRNAGQTEKADKFFDAKVRWVERRIMGAR